MITIAVAKGYLLKDSLVLFKKIGLEFEEGFENSRKLSIVDSTGNYQLLQIRPWDVPVYVEQGAADFGIVGQDVLLEQNSALPSLLDLKFGGCKLILAGLKNRKNKGLYHNMTVATKYPHSTETFFRNKGLKVNLIKLYGAVELAPLAKLSDIICDLTATGSSLKENNLEIVDTLYSSTARLIANPIGLRVHYNEITELTKKLSKYL